MCFLRRFSPSLTALYCTLSAPFKSQDAYNSASRPFANVVGYATKSTTSQSVMWAPMFNADLTSNGTTYKLGDFKATGMDGTSDFIQFLDADTLESNVEAVYLDAATYGDELAGWWDFNDVGGTSLDDQTFPFTTAFLAAFPSGNEISFTFSGSVLDGEKTFSTSAQSPMFGNFQPTDMTLDDITATGMDGTSDFIQLLDPDTLDSNIEAVYLDKETYGDELAGWWDFNDIGGTPLGDTPVPAGQGFLGAFPSGNAITITFPAAY